MPPFFESPFTETIDVPGSNGAELISTTPPSTATIPATVLVPATPMAPGLGPSFDNIGPLSDEAKRRPERFPFWYSRRMFVAWMPKNGADGFGVADVELSTSFAPVYFDDIPALLVTPGFAFHFWNVPDGLDMPGRVYDAYLDISWRSPLTDRLGASFGATPGVYGDFERFQSNSFQMTGWIMGDFALSPRWTIVGGAAVVRQLESRVLPVGGLIWTPRDGLRVELLVPRVRAARRIERAPNKPDNLWTYLAGEFGGGSWAITLADDSTTLLTYSDLRVVAGLEWLGAGRVSGVAEVGYVFARDISAFGVSQLAPNDTVMLRLGATF